MKKRNCYCAYNLIFETNQRKDWKKKSLAFIFIDNDANVAALGERWMGAGDNQPDAFAFMIWYRC